MPDWTPIPLDYEAFEEGAETFVTSETGFDANSLGKTTPSPGSKRQDYFLGQLENIAWHLGTEDVPVFISFNGERRRMDKGCVGHAVAAGLLAAPTNGPDGHVISVSLLSNRHDADETSGNVLSQFKQDYRAYVLSRYKQFDLTLQTGGDKAYYFRAVDFPTYMRLKHSFTNSVIILVCEGAWKEIASSALKTVPATMWIERHERTLDLVTKTEPIDWTAPVQAQSHLIDAAMEAALRLLPFAKQVQAASGS